MTRGRSLFALLSLVVVFGCDMGQVNAPPANADAPDYELRLMLEDAASNGRLADDFADSKYYVDKIKSADPVKGGMVEEEIRALGTMKKPDDIKAKAQEILSKL
ncbi:MAG: hypothetical protein KJ000_13605 [Pirellulaceae bacterium]|nr:hypothetical protein [Pirellulaceae bacterium]